MILGQRRPHHPSARPTINLESTGRCSQVILSLADPTLGGFPLIFAFKLWCWRRLLRVPWTSNQSVLKEINPEYSLEGLLLKLKLQYFGYLMQRTDSLKRP